MAAGRDHDTSSTYVKNEKPKMGSDFNTRVSMFEPAKPSPRPSLTTVPLEIRLEIYRYLLLHEGTPALHQYHACSIKIKPAPTIEGSDSSTGTALEAFHPLYRRSMLWLKKIDETQTSMPFLHPAILRVSRAIHEEASTVLYGENTFQFACPPEQYQRGLGKPVMLDISLQKCANIRIQFSQFLERQHITPRTVAGGLRAITTSGGSFKTLHLAFACVDDDCVEHINHESPDKVTAIEEMAEAVCLSRIRQRITVSLATIQEQEYPYFQAMVDSIEKSMSWKVRVQRENGIAFKGSYRWIWVLEPGV